MKLTEIKQILASGQIRLTKSLGQNFLHDSNQLRKIVDTAELKKSDKVLEIGPGLGPLTELLLERAGEVLAIEKDARLVEVLGKRFGTSINLLHEDALDFLRREKRDWSEWKLVANLPYSVASPLLVELAQANRGPERMVATLQIEVAKRLMARPDNADYGVLTLLVQFEYEPQDWFKIPASCFFPEPEVDSACIFLLRREKPHPKELRGAFSRIVKRAFSQRRKMMLKLLKTDWSSEQLAQAFQQMRIPLQARAEIATLEQFVGLTKILSANSLDA